MLHTTASHHYTDQYWPVWSCRGRRVCTGHGRKRVLAEWACQTHPTDHGTAPSSFQHEESLRERKQRKRLLKSQIHNYTLMQKFLNTQGTSDMLLDQDWVECNSFKRIILLQYNSVPSVKAVLFSYHFHGRHPWCKPSEQPWERPASQPLGGLSRPPWRSHLLTCPHPDKKNTTHTHGLSRQDSGAS